MLRGGVSSCRSDCLGFVGRLERGSSAATHERAIEVLAMGVLLHQSAQLAIDITMRSALMTTGEPCPGGATVNFAAHQAARHQKEAKYRELLTGGRFGQEAVDFVDSLAAAKARDSPRILHRRMRSHWCRATATHGQALTVVCQIWLICFTGSEFVSKSFS